jgi:S1-C subfamily serine protease/polyhydroxyalkanoate synthesis regulator phasin
MKRVIFVSFLLILLGAFFAFGQAEAEYKVVKVTKESGEESDQGFLGVYLNELTPELAKEKGYEGKEGVYITGVVEDSPAEEAGIEGGDIVVKAGDKTISDPDELEEVIESTGADHELSLTVFRDGKEITLTATLGEEPEYGVRIGKIPKIMAPGFGLKYGKDKNIRIFQTAMGDRGKLGVMVQDLNPQLAKYFKVEEGILVMEVIEDRPAAKAGITAGDVITAVAGKEVDDTDDLREELSDYEAGDTVNVAVSRDGKKMDFSVTLDNPMEKYYKYRGYMGVNLQDLNDQLESYFGVKNGVLISEVIKDSPAEKAGIKAGDVVTKFDGEKIKDASDLQEAVREHKPGDKVDVVVVRNRKEQTINVELGKSKEKTFDYKWFGDTESSEPRVIILKDVMDDVNDALKDIRIEVNPKIDLKDLDINLDELNKEIQLRTKELGHYFDNVRTYEIQRQLEESARRLSTITQDKIQDLNHQIDALRKELQHLEQERLNKERM